MRRNPKHVSTDPDPISRFVCKLKLIQDKDPVSQRQVIAALRAPGPYRSPALADDMERALDPD
jgi:transcriptional regulator